MKKSIKFLPPYHPMVKARFLALTFLALTISMPLNVMAQDTESAKPTITQGTAATPNLVSDTLFFRQMVRDGSVNVTDIAKKYIVPNTPKEDVVNYLSSLGFKLYFAAQKQNRPEGLLAIWEDKNLSDKFGSHNEILVTVSFDGGKVKDTTGLLLLRVV